MKHMNFAIFTSEKLSGVIAGVGTAIYLLDYANIVGIAIFVGTAVDDARHISVYEVGH
jgi:hypothetical protein